MELTEEQYEKIPLTQGLFAIVDADDYESLRQFKWSALKTGYGGHRAVRCVTKSKKQHFIYMHRLIMNFPKGMDIDHINHNTLDNRRSNLRVCTRSQNMQNGLSRKKSSSRYKGVHWYKMYKKWKAHIEKEGKKYNLGYFDSEIHAAQAYDKKAKELFGEFAHCNF